MESLRHCRDPSSLTPSAPYLSAFNRSVDTYLTGEDENSMITKLAGSEAALAQTALIKAMKERSLEEQHLDVMETTPEKRQMEQAARDFVAATIGVAPTGSAYWQSEETYAGQWGTHSQPYGVTYIADMEFATKDLKYMHEMSTLVHEFAHETGDHHHLSFFQSNPSEFDTANTYLNAPTGMQLAKISKRDKKTVVATEGSFLEEAFAEETAARWRETYSSFTTTDGYEPMDTSKNVLPIRFYSHDYTPQKTHCNNTFSYAAYPALTLSLLSDATGVDLYDLMIQSRHQNSKASAKKEFIDIINSVQTGLYQQLRRLDYTKNDYIAGYSLVQGSIASNALHTVDNPR